MARTPAAKRAWGADPRELQPAPRAAEGVGLARRGQLHLRRRRRRAHRLHGCGPARAGFALPVLMFAGPRAGRARPLLACGSRSAGRCRALQRLLPPARRSWMSREAFPAALLLPAIAAAFAACPARRWLAAMLALGLRLCQARMLQAATRHSRLARAARRRRARRAPALPKAAGLFLSVASAWLGPRTSELLVPFATRSLLVRRSSCSSSYRTRGRADAAARPRLARGSRRALATCCTPR